MWREQPDAPQLVRSASGILGTRAKLTRRQRAGLGQTAQRRISVFGAAEKLAGDITATLVLLGSDRQQLAGPFEGDLHIGECS